MFRVGDKIGCGKRAGRIVAILPGDSKDYAICKPAPNTVIIILLDKGGG